MSFSGDLRVRTPVTTWLVAPSQIVAVRRAFRDVLGQIRRLVPPRMNLRIVLYEYARSVISFITIVSFVAFMICSYRTCVIQLLL